VSGMKLTVAAAIDNTARVGVETLFVRAVMGVLLLAVGCTKTNPNSCCTSADQCTAVGLKDITDCKSGNVCDPYGACVKPQCSTAADCSSPDAPICIGQLCVPKCTMDADCTGIAGTPYCASDGTCVACKDDSECMADKPVCDASERACRGCVADTECASGMCLEQQGACANASDIVYVESSGFDSGTCTEPAPCLSLGYAIQQSSGQRDVIRIRGVSYNVGANAVNFSLKTLFVDGDNTIVTGAASKPVFTSGRARSRSRASRWGRPVARTSQSW